MRAGRGREEGAAACPVLVSSGSLTGEAYSIQALPEAQAGHRKVEHAEAGEDQPLPPQHVEARGLEVETADDVVVVAEGDDVGGGLDGVGHVLDGEDEAREI